ncbi:MAG TPA: extracellular solute-binding protein [Symbiobacteriaceae bacterium]|nr:extracellular solute-binding protein [Symbiobacteriaceae bacterium]
MSLHRSRLAAWFRRPTQVPPAQSAVPIDERPPAPATLSPAIAAQVTAVATDGAIAEVASREVRGLIAEIGLNAGELSGAARSAGELMGQLEESVGQIAQGADEQAQQLSEATNRAAASAAAVNQIAQTATAVAAATRQTGAAARQGSDRLVAMTGALASMQGSAQSASAAVETLTKLSREIGDLVEALGTVAKQSNLLALNASIEAARAGQAGAGFAVVAGEMRNLASRSNESATRARLLVDEVQGELGQIAQGAQASEAEMARSTALITETVSQLREILTATASLESGMETIVTQAGEANSAVTLVAEVVSEVAALSQETTAEASTIATGARGVSAAIKSVAQVANHYARMPEAVRAAMVPLERTAVETAALTRSLRPLLPETTAIDATAVKYADWQPWENARDWWRLGAFQQAHPAIKLKHLHLKSADSHHQLALPEVPDVTWLAPDMAPDLFAPLDDLIARDKFPLDTFVPGVVESLRQTGGGKILGLPVHLNMPLMVYNVDLFRKAGLAAPRPGITWEELIPLLRQIRERTGAWGLEIDMRNAHFLPFALHFLTPGSIPLLKGEHVNDSPAVLDRLKFFAELRTRHDLLVPYDDLWAPVRPFVEGKVACLIGSTATLLFTPIREFAAKGQLGFTPEVTAHPTFASHPGVAPAANFHLVGIHKLSQAREASWQVVQHLVTDRERIRGDIQRWGQAPVILDEGVRQAYKELGRQGAPTAYETIWQVQTAPLPAYLLSPTFRRLESVAGHEIALMLAGFHSPHDVLSGLNRKLAGH